MKHVNENPRHQRQASTVLLCIELVQSCTDLIDELQRERGLSQLALSPQAESYAAALREQLRLSHEVEQQLRDKLHALQTWPNASPGMAELVRNGMALLHSPGLADLAGMRQRVLLLQCSREQALDAYSALLAQLLALVAMARDALCDAELERELRALEQLMLAKEYSGQERASGCGLLASGRHDAQAWQHTRRLIEAQNRCAAQFISDARPVARQRLQQALTVETQAELEALRQEVADSPNPAALDPVLGEFWFRSCSRRMNELRAVEQGLLQDMQQALARQQARAATRRQADRPVRQTPGTVETVLRTAAAWLTGAHPDARPQRGTLA